MGFVNLIVAKATGLQSQVAEGPELSLQLILHSGPKAANRLFWLLSILQFLFETLVNIYHAGFIVGDVLQKVLNPKLFGNTIKPLR